MLGNSWVAEGLMAFEEGVSSKELVSQSVGQLFLHLGMVNYV
jgi:hypothetical protein